MASKVYFADFRAPSWRENLPQKLARLMMTAGEVCRHQAALR